MQSQVTKLSMLSRPSFLRLEHENGTEIEDGATVGPYSEGDLLELRCRTGEGRPRPEVRGNPDNKSISFFF